MRLFVAIDIDDSVRQRIARFMEGVSGFAPDVRWIHAASLHVTLKFIGESGQIESIRAALNTIKAVSTEIIFQNTGFFPTPRAPRVFWIGIQADDHLEALADTVDQALVPLGIEKEARAYVPHLTLARSGSGNPRRQRSDPANQHFQRLQEQLAKMTPPAFEFGTMTAHEFFLYQSKTAPTGAVYTKLARFELGQASL